MNVSTPGQFPEADNQEEGETVRLPGRSWRDFLPDPRAVLVAFRRHLALFVGVVTVIAAAVFVWAYLQVPVYAATSSLLVRPQSDAVVDVKAVTPELPATNDIVNTQVKLMQSPALAMRVAERYAATHPQADLVRGLSADAIAALLADRVQITRAASTFVIEVTVRSTDAQEAADIANLFVNEFVSSDKEAKVSTNAAADTWLRQRTSELEKDATAADAALQAYKIRNGMISSEGASLSEQEISSLNQQIAQAQADLAEKQGRLASARAQLARGGGGADVGAALGSGTIGTLRAREAEASAKLAQLQSRYGAQYPDLVKTQSELTAIRADIQREIDRILSNLQAEVNVAASRLGSLQGSRGVSEGVLSTNTQAQVGLQELQRRADAAKAIYETFLNRAHETGAQVGLQRADTQVDSLATVPAGPVFPDYRLVVFVALFGGILGGIGAVGIAEYLQGGIRTKADVEERLGLRYAGAIPDLGSTLGKLRTVEEPHDYVLRHPQSTFAEAFRSVRAFLLLSGKSASKPSRAIAITSALPQEGKTTTAVCLARTTAMDGTPTVLIDCDLRRRGSSELLGNRTSNGLYDYFNGAPLDQSLYLDEESGLYLLGTASTEGSSQDPLTTENLDRLIEDLRRRFQVIIIDTAPLLGLADARIVASAADRVLLINRWKTTSIRAAEAATDILVASGARISGVALTQVDIRSYASTGYTDSYSYHKQFRGYYVN
jgi:capsular exopolysaccharide synthesis family protein